MNRLEQLIKFHVENPDDSFVLFGLAKEYEKLNNPEKAIAYLEEIRRKDPDYTGMYYHLAKLYENRGDLDTAVIIYKQGIAVATKNNAIKEMRELNEALAIISDED